MCGIVGTVSNCIFPGESHTVIKLILSAAESYGNIEIQRSALSLIVVVVCGPYRANANTMSLVRWFYMIQMILLLLYVAELLDSTPSPPIY